jgi:diguanylate cyclase (GGDEF)-like protein
VQLEENELYAGDGQPARLTISIGVAEHHPHEEALSDLMLRADQSLYKAKNIGLNRFGCFE